MTTESVLNENFYSNLYRVMFRGTLTSRIFNLCDDIQLTTSTQGELMIVTLFISQESFRDLMTQFEAYTLTILPAEQVDITEASESLDAAAIDCGQDWNLMPASSGFHPDGCRAG